MSLQRRYKKVREYLLWYSLVDCSYTLHEDGNKPEDLDLDATLIHVFTATDFEDARRQQHEYLGWEPYKPMKEDMLLTSTHDEMCVTSIGIDYNENTPKPTCVHGRIGGHMCPHCMGTNKPDDGE